MNHTFLYYRIFLHEKFSEPKEKEARRGGMLNHSKRIHENEIVRYQLSHNVHLRLIDVYDHYFRSH